MPSAVQICNMALLEIGAQTITSLTQQSKDARACDIFYEPTRDELLADYDWSFARTRADLALIEENPTTEWAYRFQIPADCLYARFIELSSGDKTTAFRIEGSTVLTNLDDELTLVYTRKITDPGALRPWFVKAFVKELAARLASPITNKGQLMDAKRKEAEVEKIRAQAADANQDHDEPTVPEDSWLSVRN